MGHASDSDQDSLPGWKFLGELHSIPIHGYGVMLGLSLVVGWYLTLGLAERDRLPNAAHPDQRPAAKVEDESPKREDEARASTSSELPDDAPAPKVPEAKEQPEADKEPA